MRIRLRAQRLALPAIAFLLAPAVVAGQEGDRLTDAQIAHIAVTANEIDIEAAQLAKGRAQSEDVKAFAQTMIQDHSAVIERAAALAQRLGVTPADNEVSQSLVDEAEDETAKFDDLAGASFDRSYITREVEYHRDVLHAIDDVLIPQTRNEELRQLLTEVRPAIAAHLQHAEQIAAELSADR
jgi:putative membrane protein